jgi:hypothetical protein
MTFGLYAATVPTFRQIVGSVRGLLKQAPDTLLGAALAPDMFPFSFQAKQVAVHSAGALAAVKAGHFSPDIAPPPADLAGLDALLSDADAALAALAPADVDALASVPVQFRFRDRAMDFTGADFLLSFSQPNFFFHASMVYALLRANGVPVGKRDFMGTVRMSAPA